MEREVQLLKQERASAERLRRDREAGMERLRKETEEFERRRAQAMEEFAAWREEEISVRCDRRSCAWAHELAESAKGAEESGSVFASEPDNQPPRAGASRAAEAACAAT
jgi:hypothetical protein